MNNPKVTCQETYAKLGQATLKYLLTVDTSEKSATFVDQATHTVREALANNPRLHAAEFIEVVKPLLADHFRQWYKEFGRKDEIIALQERLTQLETANQIQDDVHGRHALFEGLRLVVDDLRCAQPSDVVEIAGRRRSNYVRTGDSCQLHRHAANAARRRVSE